MKYLIALLILIVAAPVYAGDVDFEFGTGAAFTGANGDDDTESVSHLALHYNLSARWAVGGGYIYEALDLDSLERVFVAGLYRVKMDWPFFIDVKLGYTNDPSGQLGDFMIAPALRIETPVSDTISAFVLGAFTASSNVFMDAVTAQNAVRDAQIGAGVRFRPPGE